MSDQSICHIRIMNSNYNHCGKYIPPPYIDNHVHYKYRKYLYDYEYIYNPNSYLDKVMCPKCEEIVQRNNIISELEKDGQV